MEELTPEWVENFSIAYYQPMTRLLSDEDFEFLFRQPGFDSRLLRKLRRERLQIFRQYLHKLVTDFNRLHLAIRLLVAQSDTDQSDLVGKLLWLKVRFSLSLVWVEANYALCWFGVRQLSVSSLVSYLDQMNAQLRLISTNHVNPIPSH